MLVAAQSCGGGPRERVTGAPPFQIRGHLVLLLLLLLGALEEGEEIRVVFRFLLHFLISERESGSSLGNL